MKSEGPNPKSEGNPRAEIRNPKAGRRGPKCKVQGQLTIRNRQRAKRVDMRLLRRVIENLLEELSIDKNSDLGVYVVSTPEMAHLNETFLRHEGSTDVLAFDYAEATAPAIRSAGREPKAHPKAEDRNCPPALRHGEVFVCLDEAGLQAGRFRTTWQNELVRYVVHGFLHLCGYDDHTRLERGKMKRVENRLLRQIAARFRLDQLGS